MKIPEYGCFNETLKLLSIKTKKKIIKNKIKKLNIIDKCIFSLILTTLLNKNKV